MKYNNDRFELVGKKGPEVRTFKEPGMVIPAGKTKKMLKSMGIPISRQQGGRVWPAKARRLRGIPENILRAIGLIKGKYDADIIANLERVAQMKRVKATGMSMIHPLFEGRAGERRRTIGLARDERLMEIAKHYGISAGDLRAIPASYQPYRQPRISFSRETKRKGEKEKLEWLIQQEKKEFDPNYPTTP